MMLALKFLAAVSLTLAVRGVWLGQRRLQDTTLVAAGRWSVAAVLLWSGTFLVSPVCGSAVQDALWYLTALLALCPAIAVLGARRPGAGVWNAFVILPLLGVLGWPLLTLGVGGGEIRPLRLETPQLIGFVLVLLMGAGNYMGTRFSLSAAAYVLGLCLLAGTVSALAPAWVQGSSVARDLATLCLGLAVVGARAVLRDPAVDHEVDPARGAGVSPSGTGERAGREDGEGAAASSATAPAGFDRLWSDYRDAFGIVWARRFQDRLNGIAAQQKWPARLGDRGIEWEAAAEVDPQQVSERIDQTFRWLLRRFVDPPWIEARLRSVETTGRSDRGDTQT